MGMDIDLYKMSYHKLKNDMIAKHPDEINDEDLLDKILLSFGTLIGEDDYIILCNDYADEYNCFYQVSRAVEYAFKLDTDEDDLFDCLLDGRKAMISYASAYDVLDDLGIEYEDNDDEY